MLNIIIPIQEESSKLDTCITSIEKYVKDYTLTIHKDSSVNVAQAREQALCNNTNRFVLFLDDDSILLNEDTVPKLLEAVKQDDTIASFGEEQWGNEDLLVKYYGLQDVQFGPAACMMLDTSKIPEGFQWDKYIGLMSGWLGGDFEEVEYTKRLLIATGLKAVGVEGTKFIHSDRIPMKAFKKTDRYLTSQIMYALIERKLINIHGLNPEFFKNLEYMKADPNNDRMLAPGKTLKDCFYGVLKANHLLHYPMFKRWGLTD